jgi:hypothetical protein
MITAAHRLFQVGGFSPLSLNPALWLSDTGSSAGQWDDISGNGRHATQATSANQPAIVTGALNGRQVRRFDGSNDFLSTANVQSFASYTMFAVAQASQWRFTSGGYRTLAVHGYGLSFTPIDTTGVDLFVLAGSSFADWLAGDALSFGDGFASSQNPRSIGPMVSGSDYRIISSLISSGFINGVRYTTRVENATGAIDSFARPFRIGASIAATPSELWSGDMAEIIILPYTATTVQRQTVERYLSNKYAITI